jgi:hypothetical protein
MSETVPRLYTSAEAHEMTGVNESTFNRLAYAREVEFTMAGRKVRWTLDQIAGVLQYLKCPKGAPKSAPKHAKRAPESMPPQMAGVTTINFRPGPRYGRAARGVS